MFVLSVVRVRVLLFVLFAAQCSLNSMEIVERNQQKDRIEDFIRSKTTVVTGVKAWNKDYSKCAWVTFDSNASCAKDLKLTVVGLVDGGKRVVSNSRVWRNFYFPAFEDDVRPFFDKDGRASFYGFGKVARACSRFGTVFLNEYVIDGDGKAMLYVCRIDNGYDELYCYEHLINFPMLMKILLQSSRINEYNDYEKLGHDVIKTCYTSPLVYCGLEKRYIINLPEDYKKDFKQHSCVDDSCNYQSYDNLPDTFKKIFDKRFKRQQREKRSGE